VFITSKHVAFRTAHSKVIVNVRDVMKLRVKEPMYLNILRALT